MTTKLASGTPYARPPWSATPLLTCGCGTNWVTSSTATTAVCPMAIVSRLGQCPPRRSVLMAFPPA